MIKKISIALIIGIFITIFFAQFDEWTHQKMVNYADTIARESLGCTTSFTVHSVNFFYPALVLTDIETRSLNNDWSWKCKKCEMSCSWLTFLMQGEMEMHTVMEGFDVNTQLSEHKLAIESHIVSLINKTKLPISPQIKGIDIKNSHCTITDSGTDSIFSCKYNSSLRTSADQYITTLSVFDGELVHKQTSYLESLVANIDIVAQQKEGKCDMSLRVAGTFQLPHLDVHDVCYLTGSFAANNGRFSLHSASDALAIDPIIIAQSHARAYARFPLACIARCLKNSDLVYSTVLGTGQLSIHVAFDQGQKTEGQLIVQDVSYDDCTVCNRAQVGFTGVDGKWHVKGGISRDGQDLHCEAHIDETAKTVDMHVRNKTVVSSPMFPYWKIAPQGFVVHAHAQQGKINGMMHCTAGNTISDLTHTIQSTIDCDDGIVTVKGILNDSSECEGKIRISPHCAVEYVYYTDHEKVPLIALERAENNKLGGFMSFTFVRTLINRLWGYDLQGEGILSVDGILHQDDGYLNMKLSDAAIRLPQTYNFIDGFTACISYNRCNRSILLDDMTISMHRGCIQCPRAKVLFDRRGKITFAHAPLFFDRCLINIKKDLFAIISGNLLVVSSQTDLPSVTGHLIIDRAQLKENIFSQMIQKSLIATTHSVFSIPDVPLLCDVSVETKFPIRVDTPFLRSNAKVALRICNEGKEPFLSGSVVLIAGDLAFPYRPLHITKGSITFSQGSLFDPSIELVAHNKIKKYDIGLQVTGSLNSHHIMLDSTPPLSEEQIIALLLVGSEQDSLNSMIPALIVQNMKNLLFGTAQSSFIEKYFKPFRPFSINLVPSFTDQSGRGGLRGALEIAIDDRWRAKIEKNFSLTEDTRFELEYLLSDDITVRGIRDERCDLGGEVEVRWKF